MKNRIIVVIILLIIVFLAGFVPQYIKVKRLENDLSVARQENAKVCGGSSGKPRRLDGFRMRKRLAAEPSPALARESEKAEPNPRWRAPSKASSVPMCRNGESPPRLTRRGLLYGR